MCEIYIEDRHLNELKSIFKKLIPNSVVWAYGSRINGTAHEGSDLDLAIVDMGTEDIYLFEIEEVIAESDIPFLIDVFDLKRLPEKFQEEIRNSYIVLYDGSSD